MFYCWFVLLIITLIQAFSEFGRTPALSPILEGLSKDLLLSYAQVGGAYTIANGLATLVLPFVGKTYDMYSTSHFLRIYILTFGGSFCSLGILKYLNLSSWWNFIIFLVGFAFVRISVHAYTIAGRCIIAVFFDKNRGLATGISYFFVSATASSTPWIIHRLNSFLQWQQIWLLLGLIWLSIVLFACNFIPRCPRNTYVQTNYCNPSTRSFSKFYYNPLYWLIAIMLTFKAFQNTGIAFYLVPICRELGANVEKVTVGFMLISLTTFLVTFIVGHFFEKIKTKWIFLSFLLSDILYLSVLIFLKNNNLIFLFVLFGGFYWGLNQIVVYMTLPKIFGLKSIGTINGIISSFICLGSSMAPFIIGLFKTYSSYKMALLVCLFMSILLFIFCLFIFKKQKFGYLAEN